MNILILSHVHPSTPHISAVRAWCFAKELAILGHRVLFLTAAQENQAQPSSENITEHDWKQPFVYACETTKHKSKTCDNLPKPFRKILTAWDMLRYGGREADWVINVIQAAKKLEEHFTPEVVWCGFTKMEGVIAAKSIAFSKGCPWVLDIKDNWELYVPYGLRRLMAWRIRSWSAVTANAQFTAIKTLKWQRAKATVIYSGVDESFITKHVALPFTSTKFCINLVGGTYFPEHLESLFKGFSIWYNDLTQTQRNSMIIRYFGSDVQRVSEIAKRIIPNANVDIKGYLDIKSMAKYCKGAAVNAYIANPYTFHHKLLELIACGRPIMAYPKEDQESRDLVGQASSVLIEAGNSAIVATELKKIYLSWIQDKQLLNSPPLSNEYTWANQTKLLEHVLVDVSLTFKSKI